MGHGWGEWEKVVFGSGLAHLPSALCSAGQTDAWPGRCVVGFQGSVASSQVHYAVKEKRKQGASTQILTVFQLFHWSWLRFSQ